MGKTRKTRNLNEETSLRTHLFAGVLSVALLAVAAAVFATITVHADAPLPWSPRPASPTSAAGSSAPFSIAPRLAGPQPPAELTAPELPQALPGTKAWYHGVASWYGPKFNGHITANGEVFDMYAMTAATSEFKPRLPLGTMVRVMDHRSGNSVIVRITDRGPLPYGRIIDLSYGAARKLTMVKPGTAMVRLHVLHWGHDRYYGQPQ
jgi:Lytic transglycolase